MACRCSSWIVPASYRWIAMIRSRVAAGERHSKPFERGNLQVSFEGVDGTQKSLFPLLKELFRLEVTGAVEKGIGKLLFSTPLVNEAAYPTAPFRKSLKSCTPVSLRREVIGQTALGKGQFSSATCSAPIGGLNFPTRSFLRRSHGATSVVAPQTSVLPLGGRSPEQNGNRKNYTAFR